MAIISQNEARKKLKKVKVLPQEPKTQEQIESEKEKVAEMIAAKPKTNMQFIAQREKLKAQGLSGIEATTAIEQQREKDLLESKTAIEQQRKKQEILPVAEEAGVFEETPERVELDVTEEERKANPMTYKRALFGSPLKFAVETIFGKNKDKNKYRIDDLIENPETLRQVMLNEIQRDELDKSLTTSQKLGSMLEPYLGDLKVFDVDLGGYVDTWLRMPKKEIDLIVNQIGEMEGVVSGMTDAASQGEIGNPSTVLRDIAQKEETLAIYEARIKRLILESDELKANPEQINLIEEKILAARLTFFEAKQRAAEGALITPTDSQLFLKLKGIRENEK